MVQKIKLAWVIYCLVLGLTDKLWTQNCSVNAGMSDTICSTETLILNGNLSGNYSALSSWSIISGQSVNITNPNAPITTVTGISTPGTYQFEIGLQCLDLLWARDTVLLVILTPPLVNAGNDTLVCGNTYSTNGKFTGIGTAFSWTSFPNFGLNATFANPSDSNTIFSVLSNGNCTGTHSLVYTVNNSHCIARDTVLVTMVNATPPNVYGNHFACGTSFQLLGNNQGCSPYQSTAWTVLGDSGFSYTYTGNFLQMTNLKKTTYTII